MKTIQVQSEVLNSANVRAALAGVQRQLSRRVFPFFALLIAAAVAFMATTAPAASTYYWDNNTATAGFGTAGSTWSSAASLFSTDATGATNPTGTVVTAAGDLINFGTAALGLGAGTITVSGTVNAGSLTYGSASGAINLSGGTIALSLGTITNSSTTAVQLFNSNLTLGASSTWTLGAGATFNNAISGAFATRIDSNNIVTLAVSNSGDTGVASTIGSVSYVESFRLNSGTTLIGTSTSLGTGAIDFRATLAANTALTGANKLTNTFVLPTSGSNPTIGGTNNIELGGALNVSSGSPAVPTLNITNTGTTTISGVVALSDLVTAAKGLTVDVNQSAGAATISGAIQNFTGAGGLASGFTKIDGGSLTLSGINTYTGATTVNTGTLQVGDGTNGSIAAASALSFGGTGTLNRLQAATAVTQTFASLAFTAGDGTVQSSYGAASGNGGITFTSGTITRSAGTGGNIVVNGGVNGSSNKVVFTGLAAGFIGKGIFFNGADFAWYDATGYVRAAAYGTDAGTSAVNTYAASTAVEFNSSQSVVGSFALTSLNLSGSGAAYNQDTGSTLTTGQILKSGGGAGSITGGAAVTSVGGNTELVIRTDTASDSLTIAIPITGTTGSLTKTGLGTLTLQGTNTYTGITNVDNGIMTLSGANTTGSQYVVNNSVLNFSGSNYTGSSGAAFIAGSITGLGTINVTSGTVTPGQYLVAGITTAGSYGIWNISGGQVAISSGNAGTIGATAGTFGQVNVTGANGYVSTAANATSGLFVGENGTGTLNLSGSGSITLGGGIAASNGLSIARTGTASVGIVNLGAVGSGGGTITTNVVSKGAGASAIFNFHGGTLKATSTFANTAFMTGLSAAYVYGEGGTIDNNGSTITIAQAFLAPTGNGANGTPTLISGGSGYFTAPYVSIVNSLGVNGTGATAVATVSGGAVTGITITNPGTGYTGPLAFVLSGGGGTGASFNTLTPTANTSGGLTYQGAGTTTLSGASTYTGATLITAGTVKNGANVNPIPVGSSLAVSGGTYDLNAFGDTVANLSDGGTSLGTLTDSGAIATLQTNGTTNSTFSGRISGTLGLTQAGISTLTISDANNTYSGGTSIGVFQNVGSVLRATATQALGSGTITFDTAGNASTARLELAGGISLNNAIAFTGRGNASVGIENISGSNTLSGLVSLGTGGGTYIVQSDAGTLAFTNAGTSTINSGKVFTFQGAGNGSFAGILAGAGGTAKSGAGQWTLSGVNSYTAATSITGGILNIGGSGSINTTSGVTLGNGELAVNSSVAFSQSIAYTSSTSNKLSGTGTITQAVNLGTTNTNTIAPGSSSATGAIGKLSLTNSFVLGSGGTLAVDLASGSHPNAVTDYDQVAVANGNVDVTNGNLALVFNSTVLNGDVFYIVDDTGSGSVNGQFTTASINGASASIASLTATTATVTSGSNIFTINYADTATGSTALNDISLTATQVPEPTSLAVFGLAGGLVLRRRRRAK